MPDYIMGNEEASSETRKKSQAFYATHYMEGGAWKRSSLMNRSFISFSYDGKPIEDFNLIATIQNDRIQRNAYASFEDSTTNYETINGQFYWGTHFLNNGITFALATDGITEDELNEFKRWFRPGRNKELVLAENPNRAILARVASAPVYSLLPFEEKVETKVERVTYKTSTTLYKGEISLSFVMDEPFWYSRAPLIKYYYTDKENKFGSMKNNLTQSEREIAVESLQDADIVKVIVEDHIPYVDSLAIEAILSDNTYAVLHGNGSNYFSSVVADNSIQEDNANYYAHTDSGDGDPVTAPSGMVGVMLREGNDSVIPLNLTLLSGEGNECYLYYSGTAPSKPIISFSLTPQISDSGIPFIERPYNTYAKSSEKKAYNYIRIGTDNDYTEMRFTLPSVWLGYNQALAIVRDFIQDEKSAVEELRTLLITGVNEYYARAWAIYCLEKSAGQSITWNDNHYYDPHTGQIGVDGDDRYVCSESHFSRLRLPYLSGLDINNLPENYFLTLYKNNDYIGFIYSMNQYEWQDPSHSDWDEFAITVYKGNEGTTNNPQEYIYFSNTTGILTNDFFTNFDNEMKKFIDNNNVATFTFNSKTGESVAEIPIKKVGDDNFTIIDKMVGDMLRSDYIQIINRNKPNEYGYIKKEDCTKITTDFDGEGLTNFLVNFKNMYY